MNFFFLPTARIGAAVVPLCLLAGATFAQGPAPASAAASAGTSTNAPAAASPARKALVQKLVQMHQPGVESFANAFASNVLVEQPLAPMVQAAAQVLQTRVPADKREATSKAMDADVKRYIDEVTALARDKAQKSAPGVLGPMFEERLSDDEMRQVAAWMESPVAKKYAGLQRDMQRALGEKLAADTRPAVEPRLQALEQSIAKQLGITPRAAQGASGASGTPTPPAPARAASGAKK